jgi:transcription elongation factor GreA
MTQQILLSEFIVNNLAKQLTRVKEEKDEILQNLFPHPSKERDETIEMFGNYLNRMNDFMNTIQISKNEYNITVINNFPFVIIGSWVEVLDLDDQKYYQYRIIEPYHHIETHFNDVSFLSPIGKALLLKKAGENAAVFAPGGMFYYQITAIRLDESLIS